MVIAALILHKGQYYQSFNCNCLLLQLGAVSCT